MKQLTAAVALVAALCLMPRTPLADDVIPISFADASCFNVDFSAFPLVTYRGPDDLTVEPFGNAQLDWYVTARLSASGLDFVEGAFTLTLAADDDDDSLDGDDSSDDSSDADEVDALHGVYTGFTIDVLTGDYSLDWSFTGGSGEFDELVGTGQTSGIADLNTFCAVYSFAGELHEDDD